MHAVLGTEVRAGFVPVPYLPYLAMRHAAAGMPLDRVIEALRVIARTALRTPADLSIAAGAES
jgi:pyrrolidone-carboxylate peptidase